MNDVWANMVLVAPRIIGLFLIGSALLGLGWWAAVLHERNHDDD